MKTIGFVGLGRMGKPMVTNLLKRGFKVTVMGHKNRQPVEDLRNAGANVAESGKELAQSVDVVITMLPDSPQVEEVVLGKNGVMDGIREGTVVIDMGTSFPPSTCKIARLLEERKAEMLDAPVTGSVREATEGTLNIMVGGKRSVFDDCYHIFQAMGKNIFYVGRHGMGHMLKLMNNAICMVNMATLAEILPFAVKLGLDAKTIFQVLSVSGGNSQVLQSHFPNIIKGSFDPAFEMELAYKDLTLVANLARVAKAPLPVTSSATQIYEIARATGLGGENFTAVVKIWERLLGVSLREEE